MLKFLTDKLLWNKRRSKKGRILAPKLTFIRFITRTLSMTSRWSQRLLLKNLRSWISGLSLKRFLHSPANKLRSLKSCRRSIPSLRILKSRIKRTRNKGNLNGNKIKLLCLRTYQFSRLKSSSQLLTSSLAPKIKLARKM